MEEPPKMTREEEAEEIIRRLLKTKVERDTEEWKSLVAKMEALMIKKMEAMSETEFVKRIKRQIDNSQDPC